MRLSAAQLPRHRRVGRALHRRPEVPRHAAAQALPRHGAPLRRRKDHGRPRPPLRRALVPALALLRARRGRRRPRQRKRRPHRRLHPRPRRPGHAVHRHQPQGGPVSVQRDARRDHARPGGQLEPGVDVGRRFSVSFFFVSFTVDGL